MVDHRAEQSFSQSATHRLAAGGLLTLAGRVPLLGHGTILRAVKTKISSAISLAQSSGHLQNVNMEGDKLFVRAEVANQDLKNKIWNEIKAADPQYSDLTADITINSSLPQPAASAPASSPRTYTVKAGDTLSQDRPAVLREGQRI